MGSRIAKPKGAARKIWPPLKPTNPKDRAATARLDLSLVPDSAVAYMALALTEGDLKYGGYNWRTAGVKASVYIAALRRHVAKWVNGEECDPTTKVPHLANALACLAVIVDGLEQGNIEDDRPPKQSMALLFEVFEEITKELQARFKNGPERRTEKGKQVSNGK